MDAGYDDGPFLKRLEAGGIVPHVPADAPLAPERFGADARERAWRCCRTRAYQVSQRIRKRAEEIFGWCKSVGGLARARFLGRWKIRLQAEVTAAAYNLLRMARLAPAT